ncbi:hypothetical protein Daus18300_008141 [Diaporthe australafricana]|uniref:OPT oligopeptide transporter n=1 Tax=Diaporthe australafricana TaxID=127596 RepID=A0ABR3WJJ3_9PEZI
MSAVREKAAGNDVIEALRAPDALDDVDFKISVEEIARELEATVEEVLEAQESARNLNLEDANQVRPIAQELNLTLDMLANPDRMQLAEQLIYTHGTDPNFPSAALEHLKEFLNMGEHFEKPDEHARAIHEAKIKIALLTGNSPYAEVRAVVDAHDDPSMPVSTIRAWVIGMGFVVLVAFVNQLFMVRQPSISLGTTVVQLLAFPIGKAAERFLPDVGFTLFGVRHSLNPGRFNQKEHMLISIMASVGSTMPSSRYIIFTQWMDKYFGQKYAKSFAYQILLALSTNLMGYGFAGLSRRFLVYPSFCLYPRSLVTIALNKALNNEVNHPVSGPLNKVFSMSQYRFFSAAFIGMFVYFWFPDYIFTALSVFNWIAWIAPQNFALATITGMNKGLGFNPSPTFDWNIITHYIDPLVIPFSVTVNILFGTFLGGLVIIGIYYTNAYNTGFLPINSNSMFNHYGKAYNVSAILDERSWLDEAKYHEYSPVFVSAAWICSYRFFFAVYAATISYAYLYHRHDIALGFRSLVKSFRKGFRANDDFTDVHSRLMRSYSEVPEWWYAILNVVAIALGCAAIAAWPTFTSVGDIPTGIIKATTGMEVEFNVLAEFIGGGWQPGNALAMNFFKCFGYVTTAHALDFANDLKLAHYLKIPQRHTFTAQVVATTVSAFVCTGVMNFQIMNIPDLCEADQPNRFTCPGVNTYFTAAVLFGSLGARKVFGTGAQYTAMMSAFPVGFALPIVLYLLTRRLPRSHWVSKIHPVMILSGGIHWAPYNIAYIWPALLPAWYSMVYIRRRYLSFWSKYNYILSAGFSSAIAIAGVIIFFAVHYQGYTIDWWGNDSEGGCEASSCARLELPKGEYFGPRKGTYV